MKIKEVTPKNLKEIMKLEQSIFDKDAFSEELIRKLIKNNLFFSKLEKNGIKKELIGFVIVINDRKDHVNIINFIINPKYQNQGYGSYLLAKTILKIKKIDNIKKIVLNVKVNNPSAIKLYEKFGFQITQKIENYYSLKDSAYLMELNIDC
jgi:ribosomal protein S18 acetylase RimI-like enzyme